VYGQGASQGLLGSGESVGVPVGDSVQVGVACGLLSRVQDGVAL